MLVGWAWHCTSIVWRWLEFSRDGLNDGFRIQYHSMILL